ncbi:hypothetical protein DHD05_18455 [Arenibacter sp. N53]|jgi:hypothetical protein|uniref:hypothetical protein n=1 Tax=Arenibacter TaxID=178469 RepID=UPI000CD44908|nr:MULTISPECIES: hypothetical protein [Arenibacter]MCM4153579.1 hypothetical protein [Arenibacter sp. N53]|tara:strand:- start:104 stop:457 length:354 start_codon:yes stop_codon:yes gene_type:complete
MALSNFFKINLPYGIKRNDKGHWTAFNREYKPLGENDLFKHIPEEDFIYTNYGTLSDKLLMELADGPTSVHMDDNNVITKVFFYDDATNPSNHLEYEATLWDKYFEKLRILSNQKSK